MGTPCALWVPSLWVLAAFGGFGHALSRPKIKLRRASWMELCSIQDHS